MWLDLQTCKSNFSYSRSFFIPKATPAANKIAIPTPPSIGKPGGLHGPSGDGFGHGICAFISLDIQKSEINNINVMYFLNIKLSPFTK